MITGIKKTHKTTEIYFDEAGEWTTVCTYNTSLKNRLLAFSQEYPELCEQTDDDGFGGLSFRIQKKCFTYRLVAPYRPLSKEKEEKPVGAKRQKFINFVKNHVFEEIVTVVITIILTIGGWCISNIIDLNEQVAVFEYRIAVAETKLSEFDNDTVTKEYLSQELQILKLQLEKANSDDLSEIEGQIKLIEKQIEYLSKNQSANESSNDKDGNT